MSKAIKQKFMGGLVVALAVVFAFALAGCGSSSSSSSSSSADSGSTSESASSASASESASTGASESESESADEEESSGTDFSLNDVSSDMISAGVYATNDDGDELVFAMFDGPDGNTYATLIDATAKDLWTIQVTSDSSDTEDVKTEDGDTVSVTVISGDDVYTGDTVALGFAEPEDGTCYIYDTNGNAYSGKELSADDTITYLGAAVAYTQM